MNVDYIFSEEKTGNIQNNSDTVGFGNMDEFIF